MGTPGGVMVSNLRRVISSLIGCPTHMALGHIKANSLVNYYEYNFLID